MWKKILAALLASAMVVSALAGCNKGGDTEKETSAKAETEEKKEDEGGEEASDDIVEIVVYHCLYNRNTVDDAQVEKVQNKLNELLEAKGSTTRIKLVEIHNSEYADKANLALANNEINLLWNASWWSTIGTDDLWRNDAAYDVTELVKGTELWNGIPEGIWKASEYDGKILFIPTYKEAYEGYDFMLRAALIDECGWDVEELDAATWFDKLEPFVADVAALGTVKYPFRSEGVAYYRYLLSTFDTINDSTSFFGIRRSSAEAETVFESDEYYDLAVLMNSWYEKGYIHEDSVTNNIPAGTDQTQDWGFTFWTDVPGDEVAHASERASQEVYIIENYTERYIHSTTTLGSCYTVTKNSTEAQAKACIEFLGYVFNEAEFANVFMLGIEGEDWEWVDVDGEQRTKATDNGTYNHSPWETVSVMGPDLSWTEPADKKEDYVKRNESANTSLAAGFRFDKSAEDIQAIYAACKNINKEYGEPLERGAIGSEGLEEYIANYRAMLDDAGFQTLFDEFEKQWNEWYAANK